MALPLSFLLALAVAFLHGQIHELLPGEATLRQLLPFLPLIPLPWLATRWTARWFEGARRRSGRLPRGYSAWLRALPLSVPLTYAFLAAFGGAAQLPDELGFDSQTVALLILLVPLLAMEVPMRFAEQGVAVQLELAGAPAPRFLGVIHLPVIGFVVGPVLLLATLADMCQADRGLDVFMNATALGHLLGFAAAVMLLCVLLPLLFRWSLPVSRRLPPHLEAPVHEIARSLSFPTRSVLALNTGHRLVNAALVGPLPWPRYLVLTDGLMSLLDVFCLRGVVAHEVVHARANHPGWLLIVFLVIPALLFHPAWLILGDAEPSTVAIVGIGAASFALVLLRLLAHRFEFEADQLAARALGGAAPCIEALRRVGALSPRSIHRASMRHPSEHARISSLLAWDHDSDYRAQFLRIGKRLRLFMLLMLLSAASLGAWAQVRIWPVDRAAWALYTGDFAAAADRLNALPDQLPQPLRELATELEQQAGAARQLLPDGGVWEEIAPILAERALDRGAAALRAGQADAAEAWLALSLSGPERDVWRRMLYRIAVASNDGRTDDLRRLRDHLQSLSPPEAVWDVVRDLAPH